MTATTRRPKLLRPIQAIAKSVIIDGGDVQGAREALLEIYALAAEPKVVKPEADADVRVLYVPSYDAYNREAYAGDSKYVTVPSQQFYLVYGRAVRNKILAIKIVREVTNVGLKDAKDRVDAAELRAVTVQS